MLIYLCILFYVSGMATEIYQAQNGGELSLNPAESQLIAIKKLSPDGKWSFGESYDVNSSLQRGWFPGQSAMPLIDASVTPLYIPPSAVWRLISNEIFLQKIK